jgi:hypothetical protein
MSNSIDDICLAFGKYMGMTPTEVSVEDPSYIVWMYKTVKPIQCSLELMLECQKEIDDIESYHCGAEYYGDGD